MKFHFWFTSYDDVMCWIPNEYVEFHRVRVCYICYNPAVLLETISFSTNHQLLSFTEHNAKCPGCSEARL